MKATETLRQLGKIILAASEQKKTHFIHFQLSEQ